MKKFFSIMVASFCLLGAAFAEDVGDLFKGPENKTTITIVPEDQHAPSKGLAKVQIDYTPYTDEAVIYFTIMAVSYDQGEAMNTVLECLHDFQEQNQYYSYKYLRKDSVKYFKDDKGIKWARYESHVKFAR
jgi:hypothetical protein